MIVDYWLLMHKIMAITSDFVASWNALPLQIGRVPPNLTDDQTTSILWLILWIAPTIFLMLYGQRLQSSIILNDIAKSLSHLKKMRSEVRREILEYVNYARKRSDGFEKDLDRFLEFFTIMPVDMDPYGIVGKVEHLINVRDERIRSEIRQVCPGIEESDVLKLENILEAATALNMIYKVIRHFYLMGKRTGSTFMVVQIQMLLPILMEEAEALQKSISVFRKGQPIGDGIGSLVVASLMVNKEKQIIAQETVYSELEYANRKLCLLKAAGPVPTVGKLSDAVTKLAKIGGMNVKMIIMVDATVKLEGEKTGAIAEGIGAAIGGIGVERYQIEQVATDLQIPLYAIVVKESMKEAMTTMKKEIVDSASNIIEMVYNKIKTLTNEGDSVLLIGVGNTVGIGQ